MQLPDKMEAKKMSQTEWESLRRSAGVKSYDILDNQIGLTDRHFIQGQRLSERDGDANSYQSWVDENRANSQDDAEPLEHDKANADNLAASEGMYASSQPTDAQRLLGDAVSHLQGMQYKVYLLTMREGLSLAQTGEELGLTKSQVQGYRLRALAFVEQFCKGVIDNGK